MPSLQELQQKQLEILKEFDRVCKKHNISYSLFFGSMLGTIRHQGFIPWDDDIDIAMLPEDYERFLSIEPSEFQEHFFVKSIHTEKNAFNYWAKLALTTTSAIDVRLADIDVHWGMSIDIFPLFPLTNKQEAMKKQESLVRKLKFLCRKPLYKGFNYRISVKQRVLGIVYRLLPNYVRKKAMVYYMKKLCVGNEKEIVAYGSYDENIRQGFIFDKKDIENICYMSFEGMMLPVFSGYDHMLRVMYGDDYMDIPPAHKRYGHSSVYYDIHTSYRKVKYYE